MSERIRILFLATRKRAESAAYFIHCLARRIDRPIIMWICAITYRISLDIVYIYAVSPTYAYNGLTLVPNSFKYIISVLIYFVLFYAMPKKEMDFASFFLNFQFVVTIAPMLTYYALNNQSTIYIFVVSICVLLQNWVLCRKDQRIIKGVRLVRVQPYTAIVLAIAVVLSISIMILNNGFAGLRAFGFEYYSLIREYQADLPPIIPYFLSWSCSAIVPFSLVYFLHMKKYCYSAICCIVQFVLYMCTGNKFAYLVLVLVLFIYFIAKLQILIKGMYIGFSLGCLVASFCMRFIVASGVYSLADIAAVSWFGIRFLYLPAFNKFAYYDFFSENAFSLFSDGQIGRMFSLTYPYQSTLGRVIAAFSLDQPLGINQSNTGYLGESYAQAGFIGMFLMSLLLAYLVRFVSRNENSHFFAMLVSVFAAPFVLLNDGSLLTTLLTGGMLLLIILVFIYQKSGMETEVKSL